MRNPASRPHGALTIGAFLPTAPHHPDPEDGYNFDSLATQNRHLTDMLVLSSIFSSRPVQGFDSIRRNVVFYWHTHERGGLVVLSVLVLIVVILGAFVHFAIAGHDRSRDIRTRTQDLTCLAKNIYHESRGEPIDGQYAVAEVTMNRVASKHYPNTICEVVYQEKFDVIRKRNVSAFSWTELDVTPPTRGKLWNRAWQIAEDVYDERAEPRVEGALFYHSTYIRPRWSRRKRRIAKIGNHVFY